MYLNVKEPWMEMLLYALYLALCRHSGGIVAFKILISLLLENYKDDSSFDVRKGG